MTKIWLPARLYGLLPLIYLLFGLLMLFVFGNDLWGAVAGALLCAASALILALRFYARGKATVRKR